jgi:hypothetical protein
MRINTGEMPQSPQGMIYMPVHQPQENISSDGLSGQSNTMKERIGSTHSVNKRGTKSTSGASNSQFQAEVGVKTENTPQSSPLKETLSSTGGVSATDEPLNQLPKEELVQRAPDGTTTVAGRILFNIGMKVTLLDLSVEDKIFVKEVVRQ